MNERRGIKRIGGVTQLIPFQPLNASDIKRNGWAGNKDGQMYIIDSPGAVPSDAVIRGGMAFSPTGAMYINKGSGTPGTGGQARTDQIWVTGDGVHPNQACNMNYLTQNICPLGNFTG